MPELNETKHDLIDVGEENGAEINFDDNNEPQKETVVEEKIEVEQEEKETPVETKKEETKNAKDELAEYSEGVQRRISKLTRKMREAERQREEAITYAQLTKRQKDELEQRMSAVDKGYATEFESRIKTSLAAAKLALKNAIESQDIEAQISAQEQLANLSVENARLNSLKASQPIETRKEVNITPQQYQQEILTYNGRPVPNDVPTDPKAELWASKNTWFGNDSAMTYTAFDMHKKLVEEEGYDPKSDEYYEEIDKRIRLEFPHKFDKIEGNTIERAKPAQAVASAKRSAPTGRRKTVKLSPSQVAIAKRLGVPLEEYAKQLNITEGV
jgi:hypothetical protein